MALPYISLAIDVINQNLIVTGFGKTKQDCEDHAERFDSPYQRTLCIDGDMANNLFQWLTASGVPTSGAVQIIRTLGSQLLGLMGGNDGRQSMEGV